LHNPYKKSLIKIAGNIFKNAGHNNLIKSNLKKNYKEKLDKAGKIGYIGIKRKRSSEGRMHLLTVFLKLVKYKLEKKVEFDCKPLSIFINAETEKEAMIKMSEELNKYFEIADLKVTETNNFADKTVHNIKVIIAR
jgi:hypothetical protein